MESVSASKDRLLYIVGRGHDPSDGSVPGGPARVLGRALLVGHDDEDELDVGQVPLRVHVDPPGRPRSRIRLHDPLHELVEVLTPVCTA